MQSQDNQPGHRSEPLFSKWAVALVALLAVAVTAGVSLAYLSRDRRQLNELAATNQALTVSLAQLRTDLQSTVERLNAQTAAARVTAPRAVAPRTQTQAKTRSSSPTPPAVDPRVSRLQGQLESQQKELASTREDLNKTRENLQSRLDSTRDELSGSLNSTRDELSGSIARSHDEIVALQKRGERNYYEFHMDKSKDFRRIGPVSLSLRKVNVKRKSYDLAMVVDDNQLQKKGVNLYEPVWIRLEDRPQPVELVVNKISKNQVEGYISEPKYKQSELGESARVTQPLTQPQQQ
jgi:hypothetical protein